MVSVPWVSTVLGEMASPLPHFGETHALCCQMQHFPHVVPKQAKADEWFSGCSGATEEGIEDTLVALRGPGP